MSQIVGKRPEALQFWVSQYLHMAVIRYAEFLYRRSNVAPIRLPVASSGFPNHTSRPQLGDGQVRFANVGVA